MDDMEQCNEALRKTLKQCCPPVHLSVLLRAYRMENGKEVPYEQYGYSDPADFLRENFPELSVVDSSCDRDYVVHLKSQISPTASNNVPGRTPATPTTPSVTMNLYTPRKWQRPESGKPKTVPVKFKIFLARIIEQYPFGISARDFVDVFFKTSGSVLSYQLYGYPGHLSMFKDLPDVFRIEQISENEHKLFPREKSEPRPIIANELKTRFENGLQAKKTISTAQAWSHNDCGSTPMKAMTKSSNVGIDPVRKWTTPMGTLITVSLDGNVLVPTGCLASMIGLEEDQILIKLKQQGIDVRGVKFLSNEIPEHSLLLEKLAAFRCPSLMSDDGRPVCVISLVPVESCSFILRAFTKMPPRLQTQTEEIRNVVASLGAS